MEIDTQYLGCAPCRMVWRAPEGIEACPACQMSTGVKRLKYGERYANERTNFSPWHLLIAPEDCIVCDACYHHHRVNETWLKEANGRMRHTSNRSLCLTVQDRSKFICSVCGERSASIFRGTQAKNNSPSKLIQLVKQMQNYYEELVRQTELEIAESRHDSEAAEAYWRGRGAYEEFDTKTKEENQ